MILDETNVQVKVSSKRFRKLLLRLFVALIFVCILYFTYTLTEQPNEDPVKIWSIKQMLQNALIRSSSRVQNKRHLILLWTPFFGRQNWLPSTKDLFCPTQGCDLTSDRHRLRESSAVILHWRDINPHELPVCIRESDNSTKNCPLMVLFNKESPPHTYASSIENLYNKIHWTVTYRRDSDIVTPYGKLVAQQKVVSLSDVNLNRSSVCWLVSNCHTISNREKYVEELKRHINVEVYGKCGDKKCPYENKLACYEWLSTHCRFYLSFENSICKDYSTEKLYFAMMSSMVPIVLGGDDYAKHLPAHSFINVKDFSSQKALSDYLRELIKDNTKYLAYFEWKKTNLVLDTGFLWICDLCEKLHKTRLSLVEPYEDIRKWWYEQSECLSA